MLNSAGRVSVSLTPFLGLPFQLYEAAKETILFCIDASKSMQTTPPSKKGDDPKCNLLMALECAADLQKRLVLFNPGTSVGVVLFNTVRRFCS